MTWAEIEALTRQVKQLPAARQQTSQQLSQVMVSAHSTMIEGSRVTVVGFSLQRDTVGEFVLG